MNEDIAKEFAEEIGFDDVEHLGTFEQYDVFKPVMDDPDEILFIGMPFYIVVKDGEAFGAYGEKYQNMRRYFEGRAA